MKFVKHPVPVIGGEYGTCFDMSVRRENGEFTMWFSWRPEASVARITSADGITWDGPPRIVLPPRSETGWENDINRPGVLFHDGLYRMWYTGQTRTHSALGYATSPDGVNWERRSDKPVMTPEAPWEKVAIMCPHVLWDDEADDYCSGGAVRRPGCYKMWYSAGDQYEPNALGYATSPDGFNWKKRPLPVLVPDPANAWEQHKVAGAQVIKTADGYLMFYIGFENEHHAQIGMARSSDGIAWERCAGNPIIPTGAPDAWDAEACYKPFAIYDDDTKRWLLWYNGRRGHFEQIGLAYGG
ncbi:MAG: hypothetical protein FWG05_00520 [Kiritimatiellaeota bacterium]|nr:hypothetical protein [Kiritimatiellota bacterium]